MYNFEVDAHLIIGVQKSSIENMAKDNMLAKYAVNTMNVPIGISEYDMNSFVAEHFKSSISDVTISI